MWGQVRRHTTTIFTCAVEFATVGPPRTAFAAVEAELRRLDRIFSRFRPDSELSRLNAAAGDWFAISPRMHRLLAHAMTVAVSSRGLVNAAILGALVDAGYDRSWDFGLPDIAAGRSPLRGPVAPLTSVLELQDGRARLAAGFAVDFGAIAKGLWADDFSMLLGPNAVCSLGGDLMCRGDGPDGAGWPVRVDGTGVIRVKNAGVATSGTGKRRWGPDSHHLIDPRTGRPCRSDIVQATVIARSAATADWMASALVVGGTVAAEFLERTCGPLEFRIERERSIA